MSNTPWDWPNSVITRVIDGDSIVARLTRDVGFHGILTFDQKLRLNRINTPPVSTPQGKAALDFTTLKLLGAPFLFVTTVKPYKYGDEWMGEITLPDGTNISDLLVTNGLAVYWDGSGPRPGG